MAPLLTPLKIKSYFKFKENQQTDQIIIISEDEKSYFFNELFTDQSLGNYSLKTQKQNYYIDRYISYEIEKIHLDNLILNEIVEGDFFEERIKIKLLHMIYESLEKNMDDHTIVFLRPRKIVEEAKTEQL
ncbi:hypothetical protein [Mycoplasmopsis agassizii]|uniref:Uncharacterized protein n=1 Tax=Mycoplasmopsis agassizii TaxID=33922 RepID=A0ABX4H5E2_9BACT|nr:hypothetical protein [Mycoplasmopsis agassizii]PAF55116.1 hypothetical protein CJF60_00305 [Mycoplasmopsis agassizii]SMC16587.1 hypothetical protein SAMN02745179_00284 [Mycoplasmopsis agassizii]